MSDLVQRLWYGTHPWQWILRPFSYLYRIIVALRRVFLQRFWQQQSPVPIIVVGNVTVGGVGKTPLVITLAKHFQEKGLKVGIVSRGYKAQIKHFPYEIKCDDSATIVGDEPLLLAQKTLCPVVIAPKRMQAVNYLLNQHQVQIIISDDGLQHYAMGRDIEIVVIDGSRGLGNGYCLPAGPLREPAGRLRQADFVLVNEGNWPGAFAMHLQPGKLIELASSNAKADYNFTNPVAAVAGIGNPQRFFTTLQQLGIKFNAYSYPDHYQFSANDLKYDEPAIIMTEKDAVKCRILNLSNKLYYLPVEAVVDGAFWDSLWSHQKLQGLVPC